MLIVPTRSEGDGRHVCSQHASHAAIEVDTGGTKAKRALFCSAVGLGDAVWGESGGSSRLGVWR
jgi:hypothetical protein